MVHHSIVKLFTAVLLSIGLLVAKPLEVWIMPNGANPQVLLEQRLKIFEKETGIKTKVVVLDWGEAWSSITRALDGKVEAPAVMQLGSTWVSYFASRGQLAKLDPYLSEIQPKRFVKVSWNTVGTDGDPSAYSIPWFIDARLLLANKNILNTVGVTADDISTYDKFYSTLEKINSAKMLRSDGSQVKAFAFPGKSDWNIPHNFAPWVWSNGGSFLIKDKNGIWRSNLLDPHTVEGIGLYLNFILDSLVEKKSLRDNTAQVVQHFNNGETAFIVNSAEVVMQTRFGAAEGGLATSKIGSDGVVFMPIPTGKAGSVCFVGGSNLAIPAANAKDPNSIKLLEFLVRDDNIDAYTKQIGFLPPLTNILQGWAKDSVYKVLIDHVEDGRSYPNIPEWSLIEGLLVSLFSDIWDMLDIGGLYSDEAVYGTLVTYEKKINDLLHVPHDAAQPMQLDEFLELWKKTTHHHLKEQSNVQKQVDSTATVEENSPSKIGLTIFVFLVAVFSSFIFTYMRKRHP